MWTVLNEVWNPTNFDYLLYLSSWKAGQYRLYPPKFAIILYYPWYYYIVILLTIGLSPIPSKEEYWPALRPQYHSNGIHILYMTYIVNPGWSSVLSASVHQATNKSITDNIVANISIILPYQTKQLQQSTCDVIWHTHVIPPLSKKKCEIAHNWTQIIKMINL